MPVHRYIGSVMKRTMLSWILLLSASGAHAGLDVTAYSGLTLVKSPMAPFAFGELSIDLRRDSVEFDASLDSVLK